MNYEDLVLNPFANENPRLIRQIGEPAETARARLPSLKRRFRVLRAWTAFKKFCRMYNFASPWAVAMALGRDSEVIFFGAFFYAILGAWFGLPFSGMIFFLWVAACFSMILQHFIVENFENIRGFVFGCVRLLFHGLVQPTARTVNETLTNVNALVTGFNTDDTLSLTGVVGSLQKHPIGVSCALKNVTVSKDWNDFARHICVLGSLAGLETSVVNSMLKRVFAARQVNPGAAHAGLGDALKGVKAFDVKRLTGLAALGTSVVGMTVEGQDHLKFLRSAVANQVALEKAWDMVEECLNSLGIVSTGKWAYLEELQKKYDGLEPEFKFFMKTLSVTPSDLCRPTIYARYQRFRKGMEELDKTCRMNTCPDIKNSKIFMSLQTLIAKALTWDAQVSQVRSTVGARPVPVGICLHGESQLGKSMLASELIARVKRILHAKYNEDPERYASFCMANEWSTWNMQVRDDYDEGYGGNEITYADDCFADKEHKDHPMWLTFISSACVGTVQARLDQKGSPYVSRLAVASCNNLPRTSTTINNVDALWRRFPFTVSVRLRDGEQRKTVDDAYDPDFSHLEFHVNSMDKHCQLNPGNCKWVDHGPTTCEAQSKTLDQLAKEIAQACIANDMKFVAQMHALGTVHVGSDEETLSNAGSGLSSDVPSSFNGSEVDGTEEAREYIEEALLHPVVHDWCDPVFTTLARKLPSRMNLPNCFEDLLAMRGLNGVDTYRYLMECGRSAENLDPEVRQGLIRLAATPLLCIGINGDTYLVWHRINQGVTFVRYCVGNKPELLHMEAFLEHLQEAGTVKNGDNDVLVWTTDAHVLRLAATRVCDVFVTEGVEWFLTVEQGREWRSDLQTSFAMVAFRRLNERFETFTERGLLRDIPEKIWENWVLKPYTEALKVCSDFFESTKDFIFWCLTKVSEILGIPVSEALAYWFDSVAKGTTIALGLTIVPIVIACVVGMYNWLTTSTGSSEAGTPNYKRDDSKRAARAHRRNVMRNRTGAHQESVVAVNYYEKTDEVCPFCKEGWEYDNPEGPGDKEPLRWVSCHHEDPQNSTISQWYVKVPLYPYTGTKKHLLAVSSSYWFHDMPQSVWDTYQARIHDLEYEYDAYCFRFNPLENPLVFNEELSVATTLLKEEFNGKGTVQRNWGPESGGTVPHSHIHVYDDESKVLDIQSFYCDISSKKRHNDRYVVLEFGTPDWEKDKALLIARLHATSVNAEFPSFVFKCTFDGNRASGSFAIPIPLFQVSRKVKEDTSKLLQTVSTVKPEQVQTCLQKLGINLGTVEGLDDGATALLRALIEKNQYVVIRLTILPNGQLDATLKGFGGGGLATGRFVIVPSHYGKIGDYFVVYPLGMTPWDRVQMNEFWFAQMVNSNAISDIAVLETLDPTKISSYPPFLRENRGVISWINKESRRPFCARDLTQYMLAEDEHIIPPGTNVAVWMPRVGLPYTGVVESHSVKRYYDEVYHEAFSRSYVVITGGSTNQKLSGPGDCGGPAVTLDPKRAKKLFGIHAFGGSDYTGIAYFSREEFLDLVQKRITCGSVQSEFIAVSVVSTEDHFNDPEVKAGYGHNQIKDWPVVEWSAYQPAEVHIQRGIVCSDTPIGDCVKPVGGLIGRHVAYVDKGKNLYHKSPFYGCFDIRLVPPVLTVYDERRKLPIPSNRAGEETMLHANFILAEALPTLDREIFNRVVVDFTNYWSTILSGSPIGSPDDLNEVLHEGLNGPPAAVNLHGMVIHKGSGLPWTLNPKTAKKDRMVGLDEDTGRRFFLDTPEGTSLKTACMLKLNEAKQGKRILSFCASKLKTNQLLKISNVEKGKTRVFNSSAVESVICTNALFVRLKEFILRNSSQFHVSMGMDVHSADWHMLWARLEKFPHVFDLDYGNFDKRLHSVMLRAAYWSLNQIIQNVDPDAWSTARMTLAEDDISAIMVDNVSVWQKEHGNPSGCAMTTFINCVCNSFNKYYAWLKLVGEPFDVFINNVEWSDFGDDAIMSVSEEFFERYNRRTIIDCLKETGQEVTPASKVLGQCDPDSPIEEVTFLKCFTRKFGYFHVAALDKVSLEGQFGWTKLSDNDVTDWHEVTRNSLLYAAAHGEEYWNYFSGALRTRLRSGRFPDLLKEKLAPLMTGDYAVWERKLLDMVTAMPLIGYAQMDDGSTAIREDIDKNGKTLYSWLYNLDVSNLSTKLGELQTQLTTLGLTLQNVSHDVDDLKTFRDTFTTMVDDLKAIVDNLKGLPDLVTSLTQRVSSLESLTNDIHGTVSRLDTKLTELSTDVSRISGQVDFDTKRITANTNSINDHEARIRDVATHVESIDVMLSDYPTVKKQVATNHSQIDQIWNFSTIDSALDCLQYWQANLHYQKAAWSVPIGMSGMGPTMHHSDFDIGFRGGNYRIGYIEGKDGPVPRTNIESGDNVTFSHSTI